VIGCEYASIFARLGSRVTIVDRRTELLRNVDHEVVAALRDAFAQNGIGLGLGATIGPITRGHGSLHVALNGKDENFDAVLVCMGRQPNTQDLGLERAGVQVNERGYIAVDASSFRTSQSHIYAVGDVIGPPALAAASAEQGRIAACRIAGISCEEFPPSFPYGIYTLPEISLVGALETELREKCIPYLVGRAPFAELARGLIAGEQGFLKLLVHRENHKLLGVHAIGQGACEFIHIGQLILALGTSIEFLVTNVFNYPTFAEAYKAAAHNALNQIR
jgi:NAD(P) transhydrogenase